MSDCNVGGGGYKDDNGTVDYSNDGENDARHDTFGFNFSFISIKLSLISNLFGKNLAFPSSTRCK